MNLGQELKRAIEQAIDRKRNRVLIALMFKYVRLLNHQVLH